MTKNIKYMKYNSKKLKRDLHQFFPLIDELNHYSLLLTKLSYCYELFFVGVP